MSSIKAKGTMATLRTMKASRTTNANGVIKAGIFLPLYNAEKAVSKNISSLLKELETIRMLKIGYHIYLVDDASTDSTPILSKRIASSNKDVTYIRYDKGPSRRENLFCSMAKAKEDFLIFMDVDLTTDSKDLKKMIEALEAGDEIVIGDRYIPGSSLKRSFNRLVISRIYNSAISLAFGSKIKDHQCGFKGFRRDTFLRLYRLIGYDSSFRRGWFIDAELLLLAQKLKIPITEIGVLWEENRSSTFNIPREMRMLPYVMFSFPQKLRKLKKNI